MVKELQYVSLLKSFFPFSRTPSPLLHIAIVVMDFSFKSFYLSIHLYCFSGYFSRTTTWNRLSEDGYSCCMSLCCQFITYFVKEILQYDMIFSQGFLSPLNYIFTSQRQDMLFLSEEPSYEVAVFFKISVCNFLGKRSSNDWCSSSKYIK